MKMGRKAGLQHLVGATTLGVVILAALLAVAQTPYKPKFPGDPAHSDSEAAALGYLRTTVRAQRLYKRKNDHYASSLAQLVHVGTFTRRMTEPQQGDYKVSFHSHKDGYELAMIPNHVDADHRSFYSVEDGVIHADDQKTADASSPVVK